MNYYQLLGIGEKASQDEIKAAYKKKAVEYHPDKNPGDVDKEELFKEINTAYQVLSDPLEKARYDLKLEYGSALEYAAYRTVRHYRRYKQRSRYIREERIDSRENLVATAWAFIICLALAAFVVFGLRLVEFYQDWRQQQRLHERRETFEAARVTFQQGQYASTLDLLSAFDSFYATEKDIALFKRQVLAQLQLQALHFFESENYWSALNSLELLHTHRLYHDPEIGLVMAQCYKKVGQYDQALELLKDIVGNGYRQVMAYADIAWIYKEQKQDYRNAISYYQKASEMAIQSYQATYGKAFAIILNDQYVPAEHFDIFYGLAETHYKLGEFEQSLKVSQWNIAIWPETAESYLLRGKCYEAMGSTLKACLEYKLARRFGNEHSPEIC